MKRETQSTLLVAAALVLFTPSLTCGQQHGEMTANRAARSRRGEVREGGWRIPGADHFTTEGKSQRVTVDGVETERKTMRSSVEDPLVDEEGNAVGADAASKTDKRIFAVREVHSYQVSERVFAYLVRLVPVEFEAGGTRVYAGAMYNLYYYDEDGDGRFETRYSALRSPKIPGWARTLARR